MRYLPSRLAAAAEGRPRTILDGLDLSVEEGELVFLLGPLGAGKSSLLSCIAGLDEPTSER